MYEILTIIYMTTCETTLLKKRLNCIFGLLTI